jgi:hypothetical protein
MRIGVAGVALYLAALGVVASSAPTPSAKAKLSSTVLESRSAARIRAKGLDPADPNIKTILEALAVADSRVKRPLATFRTLSTVASSRQVVPKSGGGSSPGDTTVKSRTKIHPGEAPKLTTLMGGSLDVTRAHETRSLAEATYALGEFAAGAQNVGVQVDLGSCGVFRYDSRLEYLRGGTGNGVGPPMVQVWFPSNPVWANRQPGELRIVIDGLPSNPLSINTGDYWSETHVAAAMIVNGVPHFSGDGGVGLTAGQMITPGGPRVSTAPDYQGGTGATGVDELGAGIYLLNGYTARARIVSAHSYMDAANYSAPSDSYRGATIQQQPDANRLLTRVAWSYSAGESIDYVIEWTLTGSPRKRPLSSMPKPACGD